MKLPTVQNLPWGDLPGMLAVSLIAAFVIVAVAALAMLAAGLL